MASGAPGNGLLRQLHEERLLRNPQAQAQAQAKAKAPAPAQAQAQAPTQAGASSTPSHSQTDVVLIDDDDDDVQLVEEDTGSKKQKPTLAQRREQSQQSQQSQQHHSRPKQGGEADLSELYNTAKGLYQSFRAGGTSLHSSQADQGQGSDRSVSGDEFNAEDADLELARRLQDEELMWAQDRDQPQQRASSHSAGSLQDAEVTGGGSLTDDQVAPDAREMFLYYDQVYFASSLSQQAVVVDWSKKMTLCAGQCSYRGRGSMCRIALSEPLLKFRSATEVKETLLHEMIHAWQFVTSGNRDRDDHGPKFKKKMEEINAGVRPDMYRPDKGYAVSVYHNFRDEVDFHRKHWWKCMRCMNIVKRAMNRMPSEKDCREYRTDRSKMKPCHDPRCLWHSHSKNCGGEFIKIKGPEMASDGKGKDNNQKLGSSGKFKGKGIALGGRISEKSPSAQHGGSKAVESGNPAKKPKTEHGSSTPSKPAIQIIPGTRQSIMEYFKKTASESKPGGASQNRQATASAGQKGSGIQETIKGNRNTSARTTGSTDKVKGEDSGVIGGKSANAAPKFHCPVCYQEFASEMEVGLHIDHCASY